MNANPPTGDEVLNWHELARSLQSSETADAPPYDLVVVTPCFNDAVSLQRLATDLCESASGDERRLLLVIDDGSATPVAAPHGLNAFDCAVIRLKTNLGHQRAIALGLATVANCLPTPKQVVIMDCDGEDKVADVAVLRRAAAEQPESIVVAHRARRSEPVMFRLAYVIYKALYRVLTGHRISHGNFCLLPGGRVARLSNQASLWNHFAASLIASKLASTSVSVDRGTRYSGKSSMNYSSLVVHGLSAISVHMEIVGARLILLALLFTVAGIVAAAAVVTTKLLTTLAVPGWASILTVAFLLMAVMGTLMAVQLTFLILALRDRVPVIPASDGHRFIESAEFSHAHR